MSIINDAYKTVEITKMLEDLGMKIVSSSKACFPSWSAKTK